MSYDLVVFEAAKAPRERKEFLAWYKAQTHWSEPHGYHDISVTSTPLKNWFMEMKQTFPPLNGDYAPTDEMISEDESLEAYLTGYSIGYDIIYASFGWSMAEEAHSLMVELAQKHGVGFYDVSNSKGGIIFPENVSIEETVRIDNCRSIPIGELPPLTSDKVSPVIAELQKQYEKEHEILTKNPETTEISKIGLSFLAHGLDFIDFAKASFKIDLTLAEADVSAVEQLAEQAHNAYKIGHLLEDNLLSYAKMFAGYLGLLIITHKGGEWIEEVDTLKEAGAGIRQRNGAVYFVLSKAFRRIKNGSEDNLADFYRTIKYTHVINPWKVLGIEETFEYPEVEKVYERLLDETPLTEVKKLREITLAKYVISAYIEECFRYRGRRLDRPLSMTATEKDEEYAYFYEDFRKDIDDDRIVIDKLLANLKLMDADELTIEKLEAFARELTHERINSNQHRQQLFRMLKDFLIRHFETFSTYYPYMTEALSKQFETLHTKFLNASDVPKEFDEFYRWLQDFDLCLNKGLSTAPKELTHSWGMPSSHEKTNIQKDNVSTNQQIGEERIKQSLMTMGKAMLIFLLIIVGLVIILSIFTWIAYG